MTAPDQIEINIVRAACGRQTRTTDARRVQLLRVDREREAIRHVHHRIGRARLSNNKPLNEQLLTVLRLAHIERGVSKRRTGTDKPVRLGEISMEPKMSGLSSRGAR